MSRLAINTTAAATNSRVTTTSMRLSSRSASLVPHPSTRRKLLFGAAGLSVILPLGGANAGEFGLNDCDPICDLKITKAGNDEYAEMMAAMEARRKAAQSQKSDSSSSEPKTDK
mmetsp:Transcript_17384/g.44520  ORF Transcript_17384/g.44520 Transcript_17384/m.44520 type:complete len:114 (-) Transcript_17384:199-540(-)|eukprot:jgi/Tetstr1/428812/TSEL_018799.t1